MKSLKKRSYEKELLDAENIPESDLFQNLREIAFVNKYLGGNKITTDGLAHFLIDKDKVYHIIDIGCGAGDNLKAIHKWSVSHGYKVVLYGLDIKKEAIAYAKTNTKDIPITYFVESFENIGQLNHSFDIATCCLFCHHFNEKDLLRLFKLLEQHCQLGFIINDLHRHWLAYYFIKWAGILFSKSYLFKNDAPLSVARAFKKGEIENLFKNKSPYIITWKWAFRWLVIKYK